MRLSKKMFSFEIKIVSNVQGVFPKVLSKISAFVFLVKKQPKKECLPGRKNVTFCQNFRSGTGDFPKVMSKCLAFVLL